MTGVHIADFPIGMNQPFPEMPGSKFAFKLADYKNERQIHVRYLTIVPKKTAPIAIIELIKNPKSITSPVFFSVTLER